MTTVIMHTSEGDIKINLFDSKAPETVKNFVGLATGEREWLDSFRVAAHSAMELAVLDTSLTMKLTHP